MAQLRRNTTIDNTSLLDFFYPIGTIYQTNNSNFDTSIYWGGMGTNKR